MNIIVGTHSFYLISALMFFLRYTINILRQMKKIFVELMNRLYRVSQTKPYMFLKVYFLT